MNFEIFDKIFDKVKRELGITCWYELFDSEDFDEVEDRIADYFGVNDAHEVEGFREWYHEMAMDL